MSLNAVWIFMKKHTAIEIIGAGCVFLLYP